MFDAHPAHPTSSPEPTSQSTPAQQETTPAPTAPQSQPSQSVQPSQQEGGQEPAPYSPNLKFKFLDKEHEFDPMFKDFIKDADSEKKVRELYEKAFGLDHVKPKFQSIQEKYKQTEAAHTQVMQGIQDLRDDYARGDFESFFQKLNIPEEKVLQWVINKAQYQQLPPEQRKVLDEKRQAEQRAMLLEKQYAESQQSYEALVSQAKSQALQVTLERPDYKQIADAFDARAGQPGAFRNAVIDAGELAWMRSNGKVDLTPEQAVQQVLNYWGNPLSQKASEPPLIPVQQIPAQPQQQPAKPATIPNISGRQSTSVAKSKPKSLDDLKKLAAQMGAA